MSIDFTGVTAVTIPEGNVVKIMRKSDGTIFWEKPETGGLPDGYTQAAYIKSNGTQYINTGYIAKSENYRIKCRFYFDTIVDRTVPFGGGASTDIISVLIRNSTIFHFYVGSGSVSATDVAISQGVNYDMDCWANDGTFTVILNGATYSGRYSGTINKEYPLFLFANNISGTPTSFSSIRMTSFQIYDADILVRDFVPCINPSGIAGLYDMVGKIFYGNDGSGTFEIVEV